MSTDNAGEQSNYDAETPLRPRLRKVLVFAHQTGLAYRIELVPTDVWAPDSNIFRNNPLGKVPALVSDDGTFIGSALCCDDLDTLDGGSRLIPAEPRERWPVLQLHALADGIMEAARGPAWWKSCACRKPWSAGNITVPCSLASIFRSGCPRSMDG